MSTRSENQQGSSLIKPMRENVVGKIIDFISGLEAPVYVAILFLVITAAILTKNIL